MSYPASTGPETPGTGLIVMDVGAACPAGPDGDWPLAEPTLSRSAGYAALFEAAAAADAAPVAHPAVAGPPLSGPLPPGASLSDPRLPGPPLTHPADADASTRTWRTQQPAPAAEPARRPRRDHRTRRAPGAMGLLGLPFNRLQSLLTAGGAALAAGSAVGYVLDHRADGSATPTSSGSAGRATPRARAIRATIGPGSASPTGGRPAGTAAATLTSAVVLPADLDPELLLRRATYGPTPQLREEIAAATPAGWLSAQLAPHTVADPDGDLISSWFPEHGLSSAAATARYKNGTDYPYQLSLCSAHLGRAAWSSRQLLEVMVDFWSNHLNITCPGDKAGAARVPFDAEVIRPDALGRFEDLLAASAVHPAMLAFLDNATSTGRAPNENYARELMELHTVGVDGGYTESDVEQAALLLTGWQLQDGVASYVPGNHHVGPVRVMDFSDPNHSPQGGPLVQRRFLRYLAHHPATARFLATKLAIRFVSDAPSPALVSRLAQVYLAQGTAIGPVLKEIFTSAEFAGAAGLKLRRPMEHLVATVRVLGVRLGTDPTGLRDLYYTLQASAHLPLGWPMPNGFPDVAASWQSPAAALNQFNVASGIAHGWWPRKLDLPGAKGLLSTQPHTASAVVQDVAQRILGRAPTSAERDAARRLLGSTPLQSSFAGGTWDQVESIALAASLLLVSPAHLVR